jgi:hypothetical protein
MISAHNTASCVFTRHILVGSSGIMDQQPLGTAEANLRVSLGAKTLLHKTSEQRPRVEPRPYSLIGTGRGRAGVRNTRMTISCMIVPWSRSQKSSRATLADASVSVNLNYVKTLSRDSSFWLSSLTSLPGRCHSQQYPALLFFEDTKERNYSHQSDRRATEDSQAFGFVQELKAAHVFIRGPACVGELRRLQL